MPSYTADNVIATNKPKITAYLEEEINNAIVREAKKRKRSKSQMVEILLEEALRARGYKLSDPADEGDLT